MIKGGAVDIPICMSKASVSRDLITVLWRRLCLQPRRTEGFKFSTGPQLEAEVRDVVGMYLAPPGNAVAVCVDEKPRSRPRNGRSRCCLCARASPSGLPTTRSGTAPPLYPPLWRWPPARSPTSANPELGAMPSGAVFGASRPARPGEQHADRQDGTDDEEVVAEDRVEPHTLGDERTALTDEQDDCHDAGGSGEHTDQRLMQVGGEDFPVARIGEQPDFGQLASLDSGSDPVEAAGQTAQQRY